MARSTPMKPAVAPFDGVVAVRMRQAADLDAIAVASHDPETRRWLDDEPMDDEARGTSTACIEEAWRSGRATPLVIVDVTTDEPAGIINLHSEMMTSSIAYNVFPGSRGNGVAPRAVQLLAEWAFGEVGLTRLLLGADKANAAGARTAEKCGFQRLDIRPAMNSYGVPHRTEVFARHRARPSAAQRQNRRACGSLTVAAKPPPEST